MSETKDSKEALKEILGFKRLGREEALKMQDFIRNNMDKKCNLCLNCPNQKRMAFAKIKKYSERLKKVNHGTK